MLRPLQIVVHDRESSIQAQLCTHYESPVNASRFCVTRYESCDAQQLRAADVLIVVQAELSSTDYCVVLQQLITTVTSSTAIFAILRSADFDLTRQLFRQGVTEVFLTHEYSELIDRLETVYERNPYVDNVVLTQPYANIEELFRMVLKAADIGLWSWSLTEQRLEQAVNMAHFVNLPNTTPLQELQEALLQAFLPEDLARLRSDIRVYMLNRQQFTIEMRMLDPDGQPHWYVLRGRAILSPEGIPVRMIGMFGDINKRKQIELALLDSEQRFRDFMDVGTMIAFIKYRDGSYQYVNRGFSELVVAQSIPTVIGKYDTEIYPPDVAKTLREQDLAIWDSGEPWHGIEHVPLANGEMRSWWVVKFIFQSSSGEKYLGGTAIDFTERLATEERVQQLMQELAHLNRLGTMGQLVSELAHELNQPLYAITNFAEAAQVTIRNQDTVTPELRDWIGQMQTQAKRMGQIIKRVVGYGSKTPPAPKLSDINELIEECCELLAARFRQSPVQVQLQLDYNLPLIVVQPLQFQQVIINLLTNAWEALQTISQVEKIIVIRTTQKSHNCLLIEVRDNGPGIAAEIESKLFQPFQTTKSDGMGLGLSIAKSIIEEHHGTIRVLSVLPQGVSFFIELPFAQ